MKHFNLKIICLTLITAVFIGGAVFTVYYPRHNTNLSEDDVQAVISSLAKKNIHIDAEAVPRHIKSMYTAVMRGEFGTPSDVADIILPNGYSEKSGECSTDGVLISFDPAISVKCNPPAFGNEFKNVYSGNVVKKIRNIFEDYISEPGDIIMEIYESTNNRMNVLMTRTYKGYPVFNNSLLFGVSKSGISGVTGLWYTVVRDIKEKYLPKSPADALLLFASDSNNYGTNIVSITQGYRLNTDAESQEETELIPTWRILTDNGEIHYIDS